MLYVDFMAGNETYNLRLNTRNIVALEKVLGGNPLSIFGTGDTVPSITAMAAILHASLQQYHHGMSMNDAYDILDAYFNDGNSMTDFIKVIIEIYRESGIMPKEEEGKN